MITAILTACWLGSFMLAFGSDPPKPPPPQPPPDTAAADAAAAAEKEKTRRRHGKPQNILTSPTGDAGYASLGGVQQDQTATTTTKAKLGA